LSNHPCAIVALLLAAVAPMAAQSPTPEPPRADFSAATEINRNLPKWLQFSGEYRARFEGYTGGGFKPSTTDSYMLSRLRLGLTIKPTSWLKFFGEGQDSRAIGKSPAVPTFQDTWDVRQAFVELGGGEKQMFDLRVGRQEINLGDQRLIGALNWTNTARTFDAARGTVHYKGYRLDIFAASVVNQVEGTWDHHQQGNNIHGLYGGIEKLVPGATIEPYVLWRVQPSVRNEAGSIANVDEKIPGIRWVGKLPMGFDYGTEMVKELGSLGTDHIHSWAGHWVFGVSGSKARLKPRAYLEYNYATGDGNAKDGRRATFDQLYPTGHDKYGFDDQVGWKNIKDFRAGLETKPRRDVTAAFEYNNWLLANPNDALYNAAGVATARSANGSAGTHVGQEVDVLGTWTFYKSLQVGAGFGHIFPGEFLKKTTPGKAYNYPFVMFTYKF
jgi:hypothetical protein